MEINYLAILLATVVPILVGFIWYNPKVFGNAWMAATGVTPESAKKANMALMFSLTLVFAFFISFSLQFMVIHQFGVTSLLSPQPDFNTPGSESSVLFEKIKELYWSSYRTFKHGSLHGTLTALFFVTPVIATNSLFEGRGFKYVAITAGYWIVSMALMGGIISSMM